MNADFVNQAEVLSPSFSPEESTMIENLIDIQTDKNIIRICIPSIFGAI